MLDECGFRDLGFEGGKFMWCTGQPNGFTIWERLDRVVATMDWLDKFPTTKVAHIEYGSLDHKPILIYLNGTSKNKQKRCVGTQLKQHGSMMLLVMQCLRLKRK